MISRVTVVQFLGRKLPGKVLIVTGEGKVFPAQYDKSEDREAVQNRVRQYLALLEFWPPKFEFRA